ncbi:MAG: MmgE/PrpD family protein [Gammaproteobacteria bacterium]|nr:MmgE/PrpD family protein [Gammaproteobacteria bacterium]
MADHASTPTLVERLAAFSAGVRFDAMPREDVDAIARLVLDTLGCALGAVGCAPVRMLAPTMRAAAHGPDSATLIGSGERVALADAVLHNGALVRYLDFMDVYWARDICHPSENIPAALAAAEAAHASGRALIEAIAVAYEAQIRLADAFSFESIQLHHVSAAGFVVPLVLAKLWRLGPSETAHAVALGGFRHLTSAALVQGQLSMAKAVGYALPASECVASTRLAAAGFTGPLAVLDKLGVEGFDTSPGTASARRASLKRFPAQYTLQSPIEAAIDLHRRLTDRLPRIASITIEVHGDVCRRTADPAKLAPDSRESADHSLPCCVAMALADGKLTAAQFDADRWRDADVKALMAKTRCKPSAELEAAFHDRPARLTVRLHDGDECTVLVESPQGGTTRPLTDTQVREKFMTQAQPLLGAAGAERVADQVMALDKLDDVAELCALLAPPHAKADPR